MSDAPEKLWMTAEEQGWPGSFRSFRLSDLEHPEEYPAYVRADLYEQVKRERDSVQKLADSNYANICTQHRQIEDLTARAEAAERLAGARVKALEWHDKSIAIMPYYAECDDDGRWRYAISAPKDCSSFTLKRYGVDCGEYPTLDEAKAAAQADFERRIRSALAEPAGEAEPRQFLATEDGEFNGNANEAPIAAEDGRAVDWVDVTGWGVFKGHAIPVEAARYIATKINLYAEQRTTPPASAIREALKLAVDLVERDVIRARPSDRDELMEALASWHSALAGSAE